MCWGFARYLPARQRRRGSIEAELAQTLQERRVRDAEQVSGGEAPAGRVRQHARDIGAVDDVEWRRRAARVRVHPEKVVCRRRLAMPWIGESEVSRAEL